MTRKISFKSLTLNQIVQLAAYLLCCFLCSCADFVPASPDDYIGPVVSEPNTSPVPLPSATSKTSADSGPLSVTITQAVLLALENNKSLVVQQFNPQIQRTLEQEELAVFDPDLTGELAIADEQGKAAIDPMRSTTSDRSVTIGIQEFLPTGTTLGVTGSTAADGLADDEDASRIAFGVTQSLLRGFGTQVNLASVNQARLDVKISQYELRGFVQSLVAQIEDTYWDYVLAERQTDIYNRSLELAQRQFKETQERINVGKLAPSELAAAEAEVALRREDLINAHSALAQIKLSLLRLINPPGADIWNREIVLQSLPISPSIELDSVQPHIALALQMRPDLNQSKLLWQRDELEVLKTRNGLLPKLDLFIVLGRSGYADSFGGSIKDIDSDNYDVLVGLTLEYPPLNRAAQARKTRAVLTREQAREAIENLSQLIEVDVRSAYLEIVRTQEQIAATAATRKLQEEKLRWETEKFHVGKSTSLLVANAQRDLVASQISEVQAVVNYLKAFVNMYRLEGSLLERRGIASPGREPVKLADMPEP